ncbi:unnamed protein product [Owenia fusiformis]|uniref:DNA polymerase n=1 Tax=Owenia fusiformis TaxID=6347 RepID=A0A8J1UFK3_OWEFU|nr:unnamed protein product [Owenia fusiformis]
MAQVEKEESASAEASLSTGRSRRAKTDRTGRKAALEKFKQAKAKGRVKYELEDEQDVYEEVGEDEYSEIVRNRQEDDWIVDDDGGGYVEDGREIFDDDIDAPTEKAAKANEKKQRNVNIRKPGTKPKNIKSMFAAQAASGKVKRRTEKEVSVAEDDLLGDIMSELHGDSSDTIKPAPIKMATNVKAATFSKPRAQQNPFASSSTQNSRSSVINKPSTLSVKPSAKRAPVATAQSAPKRRHVEEVTEVDESPDIEEFESQVEPTIQPKSPEAQDTNSMEMGDIDFDDDMEVPEVQEKVTPKQAPKPPPKPAPVIQKETEETAFVSGWEGANVGQTTEIDVQVDSSKLPLVTNEAGEQVLRMYWLDAYEDPFKQPGVVYLFGKVYIENANTHVSCCVTVKNIERRVYLLPRETRVSRKDGEDMGTPIKMMDVYNEFNENVTEKYKITKFKSMKVTRQYAFEKAGVPVESDYLEVRYAADLGKLPADLSGETFSCVFGTNTSSLELLLLDRKMKGPGWIDVKLPQLSSPSISWSKVEATIAKPVYISVTPNPPAIPPLVVMTLNLRTMTNKKTHQNEIIAATGLIQPNFQIDKPAPKPAFTQHFSAMTRPSDGIFPFDLKDRLKAQKGRLTTELCQNERMLLAFLLAKIHKIDPDVIVGHDIFGFELEVLLQRISANKIPNWSKLGRLKRQIMPKIGGPGGKGGGGTKNVTCGRLLCDVKISSKELIRCRAYDLNELVSHILKSKREEIDMEDIPSLLNTSAGVLRLLELTLVDSTYILRILYDLMVLPLALQITNICGNVMSRTLLGGRSERNEFLLLHAFFEKGFIVPDKTWSKKPVQNEPNEDGEEQQPAAAKGRKKPSYSGGLVLEPKKGFYDTFILLLDFNSLYPSIIQEYNICFTTIKSSDEKGEDVESIELPDPDLEPGILPTEIRKLVESRRQVKGLMKTPNISPDLYVQYDIRQKALKLTANSMYGCLGFSFSRFYAKPLAALVTSRGREILLQTKDLVEKMGLDVIYGDTDSIMINTNSTDIEMVFKLGNKVKSEVNKLYKLLEIDIDGVFKSMLLLKKKKYAALCMTKVGNEYVTNQELKGLDIVRRDWCQLAKHAGNYVVSQILSGENKDIILENIHAKLTEVGEQVAEGKIDMELFYITKALTKNPEDYPDKKSLPHVQVAMRLNSKGGKKLRGGDTVYYVICEDGSNQAATQRAYHPDELAKSEHLKIDTKYYLAHQVHPVVSRLCDPIDGTDAARIAECLGLDAAGYRHAMNQHSNTEEDALLGGCAESEEERYKNCQPFCFNCTACSTPITLETPIKQGSTVELSLERCSNKDCPSRPIDTIKPIINKLTREIRACMKKYYEGWLLCEDTACGARTRRVSLQFHRGHPVCTSCNRATMHPEYTDFHLYIQLSYYQFLFDLEKARNYNKDKNVPSKVLSDCSEPYRQLKQHVDRKLRESAYSQVNLNKLFFGLGVV